MTDVLAGVKVIEVSQYAFVPAAGVACGLGGRGGEGRAPRVRRRHVYTAHAAGLPPLEDGTAFMWEVVNRNKRSIGLDVATDGTRRALRHGAR